MSKLRLEGKVAIITGGASEIGEAAARLFVENGALVVIADIQDELGNELATSIGLNKACYKHCDVKNEKQVEETVSFAFEKYGTLDIVFNNAGILGPLTSILDLNIEDLRNTLSVNAYGGAAMIKHAGRVMGRHKIRGSIVCTTSVAFSGSGGGVSSVAYTASKDALLGMVRSASRELGVYGIRVNCVSPLGVSISVTPNLGMQVKRDPKVVIEDQKAGYLEAKNVAEAALFLASDESGCISGHELVVDGGFTVSSDTLHIDP